MHLTSASVKFSQAAFVACLTVLASGSIASAQNSSGPSTDQLLDELEQRHEDFATFGWPKQGRIPNDSKALEAYVRFNKEQWDKNRFGWLYQPTLMFQGGTQGGPKNTTGNVQQNMLLYWRPIENTSWGSGALVVNGLQVRQITSTTGVDLTQSLGINYAISDSVADSDTLKALYWQQDFPGDSVSLRFGHVELNGMVLKCSWACDDTTAFISGPLSTNVASTNAGQGWGVQAFFKTGTAISLEAGVGDANGDGKLNTDRSVKFDELAYSAAVIAENLFPALGDGAIRLGYYQVDPTNRNTTDEKARTSGVVLGAEQDVGDYGLFARYAESFGRHSGSRSTGAAGIVWKKPFGYDEDRLGFGVSYVEPSEEGTDAEYLSEVFYRMQITPLAELSAGAIALNRPNNADDTGAEAVFNLRLRYAF